MSSLIPKEILKTIPPLYTTEEQTNPIVQVKLFTPDSNWSWYILEYDPQQKLLFGLVDGHERELGYFSLTELEELTGPLGLSVQRDIFFEPIFLEELKKSL
jgi:hypothetical protein